MLTPAILVIDHRERGAPGPVERRLLARRADFATLFLEEISEAEQKISFRIGPDRAAEATFHDSRTGEPLSLARLTSVWAESLELPPNPMLSFLGSEELPEIFAANGRSESWLLARSLIGWLEARCLFLPQLTEKNRANHRLYQMAVARDSGFRLPPTYVGAHLPGLRAALQPTVGATIHYRSFSPLHFSLQGKRFVSADRFLSADRHFALAHVRAPALFAAWPAYRRRIHAAVVDQEVWAVSLALVDPELDPDVTDPFYQHAQGNLALAPVELPAAARQLCRRFAEEAGLRLVVLDGLEGDDDGALHFLEAHPGGRLLLFEEAGLPVYDRLLDLLERGRP